MHHNHHIAQRLLLFLLCTILFCCSFSSSVSVAQDTTAPDIMQLSDDDFFYFLNENGIIPPTNERPLKYWKGIASSIKMALQIDPFRSFQFNDSNIQSYSEQIQIFWIDFFKLSEDKYSTVPNPTRYTLQYSTQYGSWNDSYLTYNCYAYALGRTDGFYEPGDFSDNTYSGSLSISELADYVIADLHNSSSTGYSLPCVWKSTSCPTYTSLRTGEYVICIRKDSQTPYIDFHFMKLTSDGWLHKPSWSNPLKYIGNPSTTVDWIGEGSYLNTAFIDTTLCYTGTIYYIHYASTHDYSTYVPYSSSYHRVYCDCSDYSTTESHHFQFVGAKQICSDCGYMLGGGTIEPYAKGGIS